MTNPELYAAWQAAKGFTNAAAAAHLGINISSIKRLKNGRLKLTQSRRLAMAAIINNIPPYGDPIA